MKLTGIFVALGTPLDADENVDGAGLRRLTRWALAAGADGVLVNGSMGMFAGLTDREQTHAISIVVEEVNGAVPVLAGIGDTGTRRTLEKIREAEAAGADFLTVLPPFFYQPNQEQLIAFYRAVAESSRRPVLLYDNPIHAKCRILPATIRAIRRSHPNVVGVKESNPDCSNLQELLSWTAGDSDFSVLTGSESLMLVGLQMGCSGSVGGLHTLCPRLVVDCYRAFRTGDWKRAAELQADMNRLLEVFRYGSVWGGFNTALRILGIASSAAARPYPTPVSAVEEQRIHEILQWYLQRYPADEATVRATLE